MQEAEMAEEEVVETTEEVVAETVAETKGDDVEKMKAALEKANKEAAKYRHKVEEIEQAKAQEIIEKSENLDELRGILKDKEGSLETLQKQVEQYVARDEQRFETLKAQVPEALRDSLDESIPLPKRIELAEKLAGQANKGGPGFKAPGELEKTDVVELIKGAKTVAELQAIRKAHNI